MAESTEGKLTPKFKSSFCCCSLSLEADCNEFVQTGRGERGRGQLLSQVSIAAGLFRLWCLLCQGGSTGQFISCFPAIHGHSSQICIPAFCPLVPKCLFYNSIGELCSIFHMSFYHFSSFVPTSLPELLI